MAKKNPSTRWFFNDWDNDEALRLCSLAARGLWIGLLGRCQENGGYLLINGKTPSITELARYVGATPAQTRRLLAELEERQVFSRTAEGVIFNRRMVRVNGNGDHKTRKGPKREHDPIQTEMFDDEPSRESHPDDKAFKASQEEETDLKNLEGDSKLAALAFRDVGQVAKTRMPARMADRHRDGVNDAYTSQAPAADNRGLARECQDHANPLAGGGQSATVGLSRLGCRPARAAARRRPPAKSPALKAKIKEQLRQKHARFLAARRRNEQLACYWAAMLGDDAVEAQRVFDETDRRMRAARWDDTREIAA